MSDRSVQYRKQLEAAGDRSKPLPLDEGINRLKKMVAISGDRHYKNGKKRKGAIQTVELVMHLGIEPKQADQMLRGAFSLPKGLGKSRRVIAFCDAATAQTAKEVGAVEAGAEELILKIEGGWSDFDVAVAHQSMMGKVGKLGRVLGPQGKMPSPKAGTVTADVVTAVKEFTGGRVEFRNDDGGNIHFSVGRASFSEQDLKENITAAIEHIVRIKPATAKGHYLKRISISATRTPSIPIAWSL